MSKDTTGAIELTEGAKKAIRGYAWKFLVGVLVLVVGNVVALFVWADEIKSSAAAIVADYAVEGEVKEAARDHTDRIEELCHRIEIGLEKRESENATLLKTMLRAIERLEGRREDVDRALAELEDRVNATRTRGLDVTNPDVVARLELLRDLSESIDEGERLKLLSDTLVLARENGQSMSEHLQAYARDSIRNQALERIADSVVRAEVMLLWANEFLRIELGANKDASRGYQNQADESLESAEGLIQVLDQGKGGATAGESGNPGLDMELRRLRRQISELRKRSDAVAKRAK